MGKEVVAAIKSVHGKTYISGPTAQTLCKFFLYCFNPVPFFCSTSTEGGGGVVTTPS